MKSSFGAPHDGTPGAREAPHRAKPGAKRQSLNSKCPLEERQTGWCKSFFPQLLVLWVFVLSGCYTTGVVSVERLRDLDRPVAVRIIRGASMEKAEKDQVVRAMVRPGDVAADSIRYRPLRYGPGSWVVRYGGWPLVYTAGKHLRFEPWGEVREMPLSGVRAILIERHSWGLTVPSLPLTLPVGLIDFLIHHLRFGFEQVDASFDSFSRPPPAGPI